MGHDTESIKARRSENSRTLYRKEYKPSFVEKWDSLIDWDRRRRGEGDFFLKVLEKHQAKRVLDVATGTGYHSVQLLKQGFDVTSLDGSAEMLGKAFDNAKRHGYVLRTVHSDWRWLTHSVNGTFDAILCLGNSFTHLFSDRDRRRALAEFYAALAPDGVLILDQRNYDTILDRGFSSNHRYYYCGEDVCASPEEVGDDLVRFRYEFADGDVYHLSLYPLRLEYMKRLFVEAGFQDVETVGDFQTTDRVCDPDFFVHVATKRYDRGRA